ncbi:phytanoyl-CoA dioxygenase family protein [Novosphingobium sp. M1R2S20]|uniref:Phytanoyl-CoA dioxygenase family protein n=1 Tax=Novosphingobium rhizovicinum TaxID=3228928 RepID=A0ABV3R7K3_9SPHN
MERHQSKETCELLTEGYCIIPDVIAPSELVRIKNAIDAAIEESRRRGVATYTPFMDPNDRNIRLYTLPDFDDVFMELLRAPVALKLVRELLGEHFIVSSFTGNIALPGSGSMNLHADQALVVPPPWTAPWAMNVIWCIDDVHEGNGATRFVPGSHHYQDFRDVPPDALEKSQAFVASAGSIIAMDGRMWHTSGCNTSEDEQRAMLFAYYTKDFLRPQTNHDAALSEATKARLDEEAKALLGMGAAANVRIGGGLVQLAKGPPIDTGVTLGRTL